MSTETQILSVVDNVIRLKRDTLGPDLLSTLRNELTRENPQYHVMKRMRDRNPRKYANTRLPPATISSYEEDAVTIYLPRGFKDRLVELAGEHGQGITFHDDTVVHERIPEIGLSPEIQLKDYQRRGVGALVMGQNGVLVAPCGGGKTVAGVGIISTLKLPTLVLVHTHDLLAQWQRELASKATLPGPVGQWGGGVKQREAVTVATIQTLVRMDPVDVRALLQEFGCVILDEAHHCPADTFLAVMNLAPCRFRFGLTATPKRKDGLEFLMHDTIGPILAEIFDSDLQAEGRSQSCVVREVMTTFYTRYTADEWTQLIAEMVKDSDRNRLIVEKTVRGWHEGEFALLLSERVGHCRELQTALQANGMRAELLVGTVPKRQRERIVADAKAGLVDAIVATKVADEGLDIENLSSVHLTTPTANESKTQQRVGRIRRPVEGKVSRIYDYVDPRVSAMVRMAKARRRFFKKWGFTFEA